MRINAEQNRLICPLMAAINTRLQGSKAKSRKALDKKVRNYVEIKHNECGRLHVKTLIVREQDLWAFLSTFTEQ